MSAEEFSSVLAFLISGAIKLLCMHDALSLSTLIDLWNLSFSSGVRATGGLLTEARNLLR